MRSLLLCASLAMASAQPGVHSVTTEGEFVVIRSAGIGLPYLGSIQDPPPGITHGPRQFVFRLPRRPEPGPSRLPPEIVGVFLNGAPIYNQSGRQPSFAPGLEPNQLLGYAIDGYPIYFSHYRSSYRQSDQKYVPGSGDLDEFNGKTTERGYAYFATPGQYPYLLGPRLRGRCCAVPPAGPLDFALPPEMQLEIVHEKPMHLILIADDFSDFAHLHPEPDAGWVYRASYEFPRGGRYHVLRDYTPIGVGHRIDHAVIDSRKPRSGSAQAPKPWPNRLTARADSLLTFPVPAHLEPWLGAWAHAFTLHEDGQTFLHLHAQGGGADHHDLAQKPNELRIAASFPRPGRYRLWAQWQNAGQVETQAYLVNVGEAERPPTTTKIPAGAVALEVSSAGFSPARLTVGTGTVLAIKRANDGNCAGQIHFPALGLRTALPAGETTLVRVPEAVGELQFACGMGMYRGSLVVVKREE